MEQQHRDTIQKNYTELVQYTNIDNLLPMLVQKKVFSPEMARKYMIGTDHFKRKRDLFLDIRMRGPEAFEKLVASLRATGHGELANLLQPSTNNNVEPKRHATPFLLPTNEGIPAVDPQAIQSLGQHYAGNISIVTEPLRINVLPSTRLYDDPTQSRAPAYSTHSKNRGVVLIINNIKYENDVHLERRGAEVDGRNLEELFEQMGLKIEPYVNLTASQMKEVILNFKRSPSIKGVDMVFVILMGHGTQNPDYTATDIIGVDNESITTSWIEEQFDNLHCKPLQKIPKIIMYQACRGRMPDYGVALQNIENDSAGNTTLRTRSDMLIAYSTLPGTISHRDIYLGTWYIHLFCQMMMDHAKDTHIEDIFKMIDCKLANLRSAKQTMQTSVFTNIGFKNCYIHPKIYVEDDQIRSINEDS